MSERTAHPLRPQDIDYSDMLRVGTVTVELNPSGGVVIFAKGFDFENAKTCRISVTKAMAWARDALDAAIKANTVVPGGQIILVSD